METPFERLQKRRERQILTSPVVDSKIQLLANQTEQNQIGLDQQMAALQRASQQPEETVGMPQFDFSQSPIGMASAQLTAEAQGSVLPSKAPVTQRFGNYNPSIEPGSGYNMGTDFGIKEGTPLALPPGQWQVLQAYNRASGRGRIGNRENDGYGNSVLVRNTQTGETLRFSHLSKVGVQPGRVYSGGTVLGASGATGNVTNDHLDLEYKTSSGQYADVLKSPYARYIFGSNT